MKGEARACPPRRLKGNVDVHLQGTWRQGWHWQIVKA